MCTKTLTPPHPLPFSLNPPFRDPLRKSLAHLLTKPLEHVLGLSALNFHYASLNHAAPADFPHQALACLKVSYLVKPEDLARIPKTGPFIITSNHPFGGLDGIILAAILQKIRPDTKVMANFILARIPELRDLMFFVDPFHSPSSAKNNLAALRQSLAHVKAGHPLIIFPAGEVSHLDFKERAIADPPWSDTVARIVRKTACPVLPVFFHGNNSKLFNLLGFLHPLLRTAMLPRELLSKQHSQVAVEIGSLVPAKKLAAFPTNDDLTAYLRLRTYILQLRQNRTRSISEGQPTHSIPTESSSPPSPCHPVTLPPCHEEIAPPTDPALLLNELHSLPPSSLLLENPDFAIYASTAWHLCHILREIGRLREITFRGVNEGTGKPLDLDSFDNDYIHLFCWSKAKSEIVGAYRLGATDLILPNRGVKGLYTRTLFRYSRKLLEQIGPALELGRSFIRPEYQRSYSPLLLLWKGIGQYVAQNPRYQALFGPVSINNQYQSFSRQLIMTFLRHTSPSHLAPLIRPNNPPRIRPISNHHIKQYSTVVRDIDEVSDLIQEIESDHKGIPILLKQYMKLSAKILGFNIDPAFGDVLDGLVLVNLKTIDPRLLEKFTGKEGAQAIRDYPSPRLPV